MHNIVIIRAMLIKISQIRINKYEKHLKQNTSAYYIYIFVSLRLSKFTDESFKIISRAFKEMN